MRCGGCGEPCLIVEVDFGIGPYEYWGAVGVHTQLERVSNCCEVNEEECMEDDDYEAQAQFLVAGYWHMRESVEKALGCTNPECHHAKSDREAIKRSYSEFLADMCHQLVELIEKDL